MQRFKMARRRPDLKTSQTDRSNRAERIAAFRAHRYREVVVVYREGGKLVVCWETKQVGDRLHARQETVHTSSAGMARRTIELFWRGYGHRPDATPGACLRASAQYAQAEWSAAHRRVGRRV